MDEKKLLENNKADRVKELGVQINKIAHDLNNVFTGVYGFSELAMLKITDPEPLQDMQQIIAISQRGIELNQQLLVCTREIQKLAGE